MRRKNKCVATKRAYSTTTECEEKIRRAWKERRVLLKYYECPICLDFHLTSKLTLAEKKQRLTEIKRHKRSNRLKNKIKKQNKEFEKLFKIAWSFYFPKKKTVLKGMLPRADRLRILAEMKRKQEKVTLWKNTLSSLKSWYNRVVKEM